MQVHNLMSDHIATFQPLNPSNKAVHTYSVQKAGEDWAHTNNTTGDMTIQPGSMNALICPYTIKPQEYRHLMKGPDKPKWTRVFVNEIGRLFQVIRDIEGTNTCFYSQDSFLLNNGDNDIEMPALQLRCCRLKGVN